MSLKFSIITPSYNQGHFIEETILSVLSQEVDLEYWVIDGGSTDNTLKILEHYQKENQNFHFISEPDKGQSDAINKGIKRSSGEMIAYLNSDDVYLPGALATVKKIAEKHPEYYWFYGRSVIINENGKTIQSFFSKVKNYLGKSYHYGKLLSFNIISQPATFLKKEIFEEFGDFNSQYHLIMDYEYWVRIGRKKPGFPITKNLAQYRYYNNSKSSQGFVKQYWQELTAAFQYSHKVFELPYIITHFFHFLLVTTWMKWITK